jgi:hypothetical protein
MQSKDAAFNVEQAYERRGPTSGVAGPNVTQWFKVVALLKGKRKRRGGDVARGGRVVTLNRAWRPFCTSYTYFAPVYLGSLYSTC